MQLYTHQLLEFSISASDGEIGKVKDVYFDDQEWTLRYFVVETGNWLFKRKVLIAPFAVAETRNADLSVLPVNLNKDQVKSSPHIDADMPVSRQQESSLFDYYSWPYFGRAGMGYPTTGMLKGASALINKAEHEIDFDPHLRSFTHVTQYEVHNEFGRIGLLKDLVIDMSDWSIPYLLLDDVLTSDQERVVVSTASVISINWDGYQIKVSLTDEEMQNAPRINPAGFFAKGSAQLPPLG